MISSFHLSFWESQGCTREEGSPSLQVQRTYTVPFSLACSHAKAKPYMTKEHLTKFINQKQRDPRLNSLLFPPARPEQVQVLIDKYEPSGINVQRGEDQGNQPPVVLPYPGA